MTLPDVAGNGKNGCNLRHYISIEFWSASMLENRGNRSPPDLSSQTADFAALRGLQIGFLGGERSVRPEFRAVDWDSALRETSNRSGFLASIFFS
jgi:hypothetical protein